MGKLYCACDRADTEQCELCPNNRMYKPDVKLNCPSWPRKFDLKKVEKFQKEILSAEKK